MLIITLKVVPASGKQHLVLDKNGQLKCYLKSAAEKNRANEELKTVLAQAIECSKHAIEILTGATGRIKRVRIPFEGSYNDFIEKIGLVYPEHQHSFL